MQVENKVVPNQEQMQGFMQSSGDGPIHMVNLLKFKTHAEYEDGRATELSGAAAYQLYADGVTELLAAVGGEVTFSGDVARLALGEVEELWDKVAIALYPSRKAMLDMMMMPAMQALAEHRAAGLAGQLNIETVNGQIGL